jgi:tetratricopeptide (TPR) repeat protein
MSEARDNGIAALQQGNFPQAISLLEAEHAANPGDYDTCQYLGAAYLQSGRPMDAVGVYTKAVHLQPASAQARYNLGLAMENAGYPEQALQVYDQAIQLQRDFPDAHAAIKRLESGSNDGFGAPPPPQEGQNTSHQSHAIDDPLLHTGASAPQAQTQPVQPTQQFTPPVQQPVQPTQQFAPPVQQPQPTQQFVPPGQQFAPPAQPGYGQAQPQQFSPQAFAQSAPAAEEPGLGNYSAPPPPNPAASPFGTPAAGSQGFRPVGGPVFNALPEYEDEFNPLKALGDCFRAMFTPNKLFEEQAGCETARGAWGAVLMMFFMVVSTQLAASSMSPDTPGIGYSLVYAIGSFLASVLMWMLYSLIVKGLASAFGSNLAFGAAFRAVVFSLMPYILVSMVTPFIGLAMRNTVQATGMAGGGAGAAQIRISSPSVSIHPKPGAPGTFGAPGVQQGGAGQFGSPGSANPAGALGTLMAGGLAVLALQLIALVWSTAILVCALVNIHGMQTGSALGTIILADVIAAVIIFGLLIAIAVVGVGAGLKGPGVRM